MPIEPLKCKVCSAPLDENLKCSYCGTQHQQIPQPNTLKKYQLYPESPFIPHLIHSGKFDWKKHEKKRR